MADNRQIKVADTVGPADGNGADDEGEAGTDIDADAVYADGDTEALGREVIGNDRIGRRCKAASPTPTPMR